MSRQPPFRPPWWPEGEPFPPAHSAWRRGNFFARFVFFLGLLVFISVSAALLLFWFIASAFGLLAGNGFAFGFHPAFGAFVFVLVLVSLMLATRGLRRVTAPLDELIDAADRVAEGDYGARVPERGPREVRTLARAFNSMSARLQAHDEQRRRLMADVAHELRTPLAVIQGNLEGLLDQIYPRDDAHLTSLLDETRVLARLVEDLRTLALSESGALKLQKEPTDPGILVNEVIGAFRAQADAAGITLRVEAPAPLPLLEVDPTRIREVLTNLVANALRYTARGGTVRVTCEPAGQSVTIAVADDGAGIAPDDLPHVFDRFYKSADSRGTGLGLAIAKSLVEAHGGSIEALSQSGKGTTMRVRLPAGTR